MTKTRICFVCLGNICRSPLAEGIFKHQARAAGSAQDFHVESAGIEHYHVGDRPDSRSVDVARAHGIQLDGRAQQFKGEDFARFDRVIALASDVAADLHRLAPTAPDRAKISLLRDHDRHVPAGAPEAARDVPDPYYGGPEGFEDAYHLIERSTRQLLETFVSPDGRQRP